MLQASYKPGGHTWYEGMNMKFDNLNHGLGGENTTNFNSFRITADVLEPREGSINKTLDSVKYAFFNAFLHKFYVKSSQNRQQAKNTKSKMSFLRVCVQQTKRHLSGKFQDLFIKSYGLFLLFTSILHLFYVINFYRRVNSSKEVNYILKMLFTSKLHFRGIL